MGNGNGKTDATKALLYAANTFNLNDERIDKIIIVSACMDRRKHKICNKVKRTLDAKHIDVYAVNLIDGQRDLKNVITKETANNYLKCVTDNDSNRVCEGSNAKGISIEEFTEIIQTCLLPGICKPPTLSPTEWPTPEPTNWPTWEPTKWPTPEPTNWPTPEPTKKNKKASKPTTKDKSPKPTKWPTPEPTNWPTFEPTKKHNSWNNDELTSSDQWKKEWEKKLDKKWKKYWKNNWNKHDEDDTKEPTPEPTKKWNTGTPKPTKWPTPEPSEKWNTPKPTQWNQKTPRPISEWTNRPTPEPTKRPIWSTSEPTKKHKTPKPTKWPTPEPTQWPTPEPTKKHKTPKPTQWPTPEPTQWPTPEPTKKKKSHKKDDSSSSSDHNWHVSETTDWPTPEPTKKNKKNKKKSPKPTKWPTPEPTNWPTPEPSEKWHTPKPTKWELETPEPTKKKKKKKKTPKPTKYPTPEPTKHSIKWYKDSSSSDETKEPTKKKKKWKSKTPKPTPIPTMWIHKTPKSKSSNAALFDHESHHFQCNDIRNNGDIDYVILIDASCGLSDDVSDSVLDGIGDIIQTLLAYPDSRIALISFGETRKDLHIVVNFDDTEYQKDSKKYIRYVRRMGDLTENGNDKTNLYYALKKGEQLLDNERDTKFIIFNACKHKECDNHSKICNMAQELNDFGVETYVINFIGISKADNCKK